MPDCFNCGETTGDYSDIDIFGQHWCEHCWPEADPRLFGQ